jgi:hypothetical protein
VPHALRLCALVTLVLGLAMIAMIVPRVSPYTVIHLIFGVLTALLALIVLGPELRRSLGSGVGAWFALLPLALGLLWYGGVIQRAIGRGSFVVLIVHALLGLAAVALIEMGLASRKRRLRGANEVPS